MEKAEDRARHSADQWQTLAVPCQVDQLGVKDGLEAAPPRYEGGILGSVQADRKTSQTFRWHCARTFMNVNAENVKHAVLQNTIEL